MKLPIYLYGSPVLKEVAQEIEITEDKKESLTKLIKDMFETMYNADGVGLAAPQIGKSIRLLIVDGSDLAEDMPDLKGFKRVMINPVVLEESEKMVEYSEGCLSVPNVHGDVMRPATMKVKYIDENFEEKIEDFQGFGCRMVQHEMDHLAGHVFTDRVSPIRRKMVQSKLMNIQRGKVRTYYKSVIE